MPRPADKIFLRIATQQGFLGEEDADDIWGELTRMERAGKGTKARKLAVEFGFMDTDLAKQIKRQVRDYLTEKVREESRQSRSQRQIAGFELLEKLGSGAMGTVFKARHQKLNKIVALKLLNPTFAQDEKYVARFLLEARAAASMNHPNVVGAFDVGQAGDVHYIAMEYVEGKTVKELITRRGHIDEAASVEIVIQILSALKHAHQSNLIHRDVKPANIMITSDGQAKLLDLGLARRTDVECGLTGEGKAIGTPYFMAPEQALDKGADYRADIYALGATMFNMVTGEKPYKAGTPVAVMNMHIKAPIPDASKLNPKVSSGLSRVIKKMLGKRPAERYQSHEALVRDLEAVLSGFMPELDAGETPEGISFIRPRGGGGGGARGGSRGQSRAQRDSGAGNLRGLQVGIAAAAAVLLVGAFVFAGGSGNSGNSGEDGGDVSTVGDDDEDRDDDEDIDEGPAPREVAERAAGRLYDELTPGQGYQRVEELEELAKSYSTTRTGRRARIEATKLRGELGSLEKEGYGDQATRYDTMEREGDLPSALEGYSSLAQRLEDEALRKKAQARANQIGRKIDDSVAKLTAQGKQLEDSGRDREAAQVWRKLAGLLPSGQRAKWLDRAAKLDQRATALVARVRKDAGKARKVEAKEEGSAVSALPGRLADLVKQDRLQEAYELATAAVDEFSEGEHKDDARRHAIALRAAVDLKGLALDAFAGRKGEDVELERRKGGKLKGKLMGASDGKLSIALKAGGSSEAVVNVALESLKEQELWRAVRKLLGARSEAYLKGVTAIKLYRGDPDAGDFLERSKAAGIDLSQLARSIREAKPSSGGDAGGPAIAMGGDVKPTKKPNGADVKKKQIKALQRNKFERWLITNRLKLFPEADVVGYADGQLEPAYDFQENQNFSKDWKRIRGESRPTPPGAMERVGLILEGNGRAEFVAPLEDDLAIKVRFMSQMFDGRYGRFAITLDGEKNQRVSCEMGQIVYAVKGKLRARQGESQAKGVRTRTRNTLELIKVGKKLTAKFNGTVTAEVDLKQELGVYKLGLEWNRSSLNLVRVRAMLKPEIKWVERKLGGGPGKS